MSDFARSFRHLRSDSPRGAVVAAIVGTVLLLAWCAWLTLAHVPVRVGSTSARIVAGAETHSIDAPVAGRVVAMSLALGTDVKAGDVLVRLENDEERLALDEQRARRDALGPQVAALEAQISAAETALASGRSTTGVAVAEADSRRNEAETAAKLAADEAARAEQLHAAGQISDAALGRARSEAKSKEQAARSLRLGTERTALELRTSEGDRAAHVESLRADRARLQGELATAEASVARLEQAASLRTIVSPIAGRVASVAEVGVGSVVKAGDALATVVPAGTLMSVAQFDPAVSLGRLRPDLPARMRLDGFPWTQYGSVPARVRSVATEPQGGLVRVELDLVADPAGRVPLEHGMTGRVEVEVERVTPLVLVLRAAGRAAGRTARPQAPPAAAP